MKISNEAQQIIELINQGNNFLLSGGAGSGKTYSLVEVINQVIKENPLKHIACITYTNAAADEIQARVMHPNLHVSTIHEFLWANIRHFQTELKKTLIQLLNDPEHPKFVIPNSETVNDGLYDNLESGIQYREYLLMRNGIISHDELIILASEMYKQFPKLSAITKDSFPFIFVDEYQDTDKSVVNTLLLHFKKSEKKCVVGFFGDAMQSIYPGTVGNLDEYKSQAEPLVHEVIKVENRRNPLSIIALANKLRNDGLQQKPSQDLTAPNIDEEGKVKTGQIKFIHSINGDLNQVKELLGWDFTDVKNTKELNLTNNLIADKAGFKELMRIYDGDKILDYVKRIKKYLKENELNDVPKEKTFRVLIDDLSKGKTGKELQKVMPTAGMNKYIENHYETYKSALNFSYDELSRLYIDKSQLIDDKKNNINDPNKPNSQRDELIKHLFKIEDNIWLYNKKKFNQFLRLTDFSLTSIQSKKVLKQNIESLINCDGKTIGDIIKEAHNSGIVLIDDNLEKYKTRKRYIYDQVIQLRYKEFQNLYKYLEGYTPFSTQHKTKGAEFKNVLVILDNGNWNDYNFEYLFKGEGNKTVLDRTRKIFYVCCTRTMDNLAVFYYQPSNEIIEKAKEWFGSENVVEV